jgi:iron complex outermembrane receptor protein
MNTRALWIGTSALVLGWASDAAAQSAPVAPAAGTEQTDELPSTEGEIIVTARRRNENLMTTPVAGSVLTGGDLANKGVAGVDALQFATPSVVVNNFGQGIDFNVRGIGKGEHNTQTSTGVITYRDGAPTFPGYFQGEPYYDVANIQVLRGPQGTIVGQNATGGAVFVNSNDPIIGGGVHGYVNANLGNYWDAGLQGAVNLPVSDTFAARVALYGQRRNGFYDITGPGGSKYTGNNGDVRQIAGRISLLWKPTPELTILSKTDLDYLDQGAYPATPIANRKLFDLTANSPQEARDKFYRTILRVNYEFDGGVQLRSVTGYSAGNTKYRADLDGTATGNSTFFDNLNERQLSQELTLISPDTGRLTWLLGGFAVWNKYHYLEPFQFVIGAPAGAVATEYRLQGTNPNRSVAAFGQVGFAITPALKLEVGGRYTASRSTNHIDVLQYGTAIEAEQQTKTDNFSYKASLGWAVDRNQYLYGFVATGFKPGGLNVPVGFGQPDPFGPEKVTSYEAGWKSNYAGGKIRTTINGFYNSYKDFQITIGNPDLPVFGLQVNVPGTTKIYGFEAEVEGKFGGLSLDAGINVLKSEIGRFFATDPRAISGTPCNINTGPGNTTCLDLSGRQQTYAPNFTFNAGASYEIDLGDSSLTPRVNFGHIAPQWATLFQNPARGDRLEDRNILNAQLGYNRGSLTVTAYATNLTNQHYAAALNSGLYFAGAPRQYGIKVLKAF